MYDDDDLYGDYGMKGTLSRQPPATQAALIFTVPFLIVDTINYFTGGTAIVLSGPILGLLYFGCGFYAAKLAHQKGQSYTPLLGISTALILTILSFVVYGLFTLFSGIFTIGFSLIFGLPFLICLGPIKLVLGLIAGALGTLTYSLFGGGIPDIDDSDSF